MSRFWRQVAAGPRWSVIFLVRCYQLGVSPLLGPRCRYQPTCSNYFIQSVQKHGLLRGSWRGLRRICRCHPWGGSGYDPP